MKAVISHAAVSPGIGWHASIAEWLAGLFMAPLPAGAIAGYRDGLGASFFDLLAHEPGCASGTQAMRSALMTDDAPAATARRLATAFALLFEGVGGPETVSPYESAHGRASGDGTSARLFQKPSGDMDRLLRHSDLSIDAAFRESPDHLSIELALLARLMRRGASHDEETELLDGHLLAWVPRFAARCHAADRTGFYAGAAAVLMSFLAARRAALQRGGGELG
jgi:TorA-specific chaperone